MIPTLAKFTGWLPFAVAAALALFQSIWTFNSKGLAQAFIEGLMCFAVLALLIGLVSAFLYQKQNAYFTFREVASSALIGSAALSLLFSLAVLAHERFTQNAAIVATVGFFAAVALFWLFLLCAQYVLPRIVSF